MTTLTMTTRIHALARNLPLDYVAKVDASYGDASEPDDEIPDIEIEVEYHPGWEQAGCRSGHPDNWTPDESEEPEIVSVTIIDGDHDITSEITPQQLRSLKDAAWEDQKQQAEDAFDPPTDY
jgi:hypothetical protein